MCCLKIAALPLISGKPTVTILSNLPGLVKVSGFLDNIELSRIAEFESSFLAYLKANNEGILASIREKGQLTKEELAELKSTTESFVSTF